MLISLIMVFEAWQQQRTSKPEILWAIYHRSIYSPERRPRAPLSSKGSIQRISTTQTSRTSRRCSHLSFLFWNRAGIRIQNGTTMSSHTRLIGLVFPSCTQMRKGSGSKGAWQDLVSILISRNSDRRIISFPEQSQSSHSLSKNSELQISASKVDRSGWK